MTRTLLLSSQSWLWIFFMCRYTGVSGFTVPRTSLSATHFPSTGRRTPFMSITEDGNGFEDTATYEGLDKEFIMDLVSDSITNIPLFETSEFTDNSLDGLSVDNPALETDIAKEMVLDVLNGTNPQKFESDSTSFIISQESEDLSRKLSKEPVSLSADQEMMANVQAAEAILAVSQMATEAAEASMPSSVSSSIPLIPIGYNDTSTDKAVILPASDVVGRPATSVDAFESPSVMRIMTFVASATGVFLCSPLLSLIDTSAVGLLSGTAQQAALNPAVAVTDYAALLIAFLYTGATNLVAAAQEKDRGVEGKPKTSKSLSTALQLSSYVGLALGSILFVFASNLLRALIGNDSISPEVFSAAMKYVRIRALGMPGAAIIGSAQAGCLGMQDVRSPLYVLAAAAIVNFLGDMIFVGMKNPWFGGAAGAAWATVFSQYAAVWFFVRWLCTKPKPQAPQKAVNLTKAIMELTGEKDTRGKGRRSRFSEAVKSFAQSTPLPGLSSAAKVASVTKKLQKKPKACKPEAKVESVSTRGFLYGKFRGVDLLKLPNKERAQEYAPYLLPVTTTQFGRVSAYIAMSHVVASTLGTSAMAAQQVIVSLFYCFTPIFDSLSLTAQSMVPRLAEKRHSRARANALRSTMRNFFKAGGICGAVMVGAVTCVPLLSSFFTSDPGVVALVNSVAPLLVAFFVVHGIFMGSEGMLLAQKDLNFIGKSYAAFFFAVPYFMLRLKRAALGGNTGITLTSVWSIFVMYQYVRLFTFVGRNFIMQRRSNRNADKAEQSLLL